MSRAPRKPRAIPPSDAVLWREAVRAATPLDPVGRRPATKPEDAPTETPTPGSERARAASSADPTAPPMRHRDQPTGSRKLPATGVDLAAGDPGPVSRLTAGLDRRTAERLRRGARAPDTQVDLHGMTADQAHHALDRCIGAALVAGRRLVLVITGKGGKRRGTDDAPFMRDDQGVLRQQVPRWLRHGPHAGQIIGVYHAHPRHGGAGALYVYLKKRR